MSPIVWNMCENIHYESVYFKELHNEQEYTDQQYTERGQLWCQLLLVIIKTAGYLTRLERRVKRVRKL